MDFHEIDQHVTHLEQQIRERDEQIKNILNEFDSYRQKVGDAFRQLGEVAAGQPQAATPPPTLKPEDIPFAHTAINK